MDSDSRFRPPNPPPCERILTHLRLPFSASSNHGAQPAVVRADVRTPFTCTTRGCREMWIENRVIHIVGITVWITHMIIHILGIILWIAWGQSSGVTTPTCIHPLKVLCATIPAARTSTPPILRPAICKRPSPSRPLPRQQHDAELLTPASEIPTVAGEETTRWQDGADHHRMNTTR